MILAWRSWPSFASARKTACSTCSGMSATRARNGIGCSVACLTLNEAESVVEKGCRPVRSS